MNSSFVIYLYLYIYIIRLYKYGIFDKYLRLTVSQASNLRINTANPFFQVRGMLTYPVSFRRTVLLLVFFAFLWIHLLAECVFFGMFLADSRAFRVVKANYFSTLACRPFSTCILTNFCPQLITVPFIPLNFLFSLVAQIRTKSSGSQDISGYYASCGPVAAQILHRKPKH